MSYEPATISLEGAIAITGIVCVMLIIHFMPTLWAFIYRKERRWLVLWLNLLTGWTGIGFVVAFIFAVLPNKNQIIPPYDGPTLDKFS